jgi:hypothetical protein
LEVLPSRSILWQLNELPFLLTEHPGFPPLESINLFFSPAACRRFLKYSYIHIGKIPTWILEFFQTLEFARRQPPSPEGEGL